MATGSARCGWTLLRREHGALPTPGSAAGTRRESNKLSLRQSITERQGRGLPGHLATYWNQAYSCLLINSDVSNPAWALPNGL
jgi:hypothetical protein